MKYDKKITNLLDTLFFLLFTGWACISLLMPEIYLWAFYEVRDVFMSIKMGVCHG